ncbi:sensor histidine kinase [Microbacterium caowuchunii]|uniref:histidine kinase n=1 Tax=Microbacterium caowuchunii TaxID=2614638 RepID=A0A5N0TCY6_9MICO|nr:sensor histidine kinase [Microbacterium caowuchunii]
MPTSPAGWVRAHRSLLEAFAYAALAVLACVLGLVGLWSLLSVFPAPVSPWWSLATGLPACALVVFRRKAPLPLLGVALALFVVDLLTVGGVVTLIVVLDLLYAATVAASAPTRRRILIGIAVAVVATTVAALLRSDDPRVGILIGLQLGALAGMDYWYATAVAQANELVTLHRARAEDAERRSALERAEAVRSDREQMARELHDLVAGDVSAIAIRAEAALSIDNTPEADRAALRAVRESSLQAHQALRSMIAVLRAGDAEVAARRDGSLPELVADAQRHGLTVTLDDALPDGIPLPVDQAVTRIVQEALTNCVRHAAGARVDVRVDADGGEVRVRVDSSGGSPGTIAPLRGNGWGLDLLRERARALGGTVDAGPADDGWSVRARLPVEVPV